MFCQLLPEQWFRRCSFARLCRGSQGQLFSRCCFISGAEHELRSRDSDWFYFWQRLPRESVLLWWRWYVLDIGGDGAIAVDLGTNAFQATQNHVVFIAEDDVAKATHDFDDEAVMGELLTIRANAMAC